MGKTRKNRGQKSITESSKVEDDNAEDETNNIDDVIEKLTVKSESKRMMSIIKIKNLAKNCELDEDTIDKFLKTIVESLLQV